MTLLLSWCNGDVGYLLADGMAIGPNGGVVTLNEKKIFRTRAGHLIARGGFVALGQELERRFAVSDAPFDALVAGVSAFVAEANRTHAPGRFSYPLGAVVLGRDAGRIRAANVAPERTDFSESGKPFFCFAGAPDLTAPFPLVWRVGYMVNATADPASVPDLLRHGAAQLIAESPDRMGGAITLESLSATDEPTQAKPSRSARLLNPRGQRFGVFSI